MLAVGPRDDLAMDRWSPGVHRKPDGCRPQEGGPVRRLVVAAVALVTAWWVVLLVPGAQAEAPEATGWWSASRISPISQSIPTPNDVSPDTVPSRDGFGGTPLPQLPTVTTTPTTTPSAQVPSTVPEGGLYVASAHV